MDVLVIPARADVERQAVAMAWRAAGGEVLALDRFWEPPALDPARVTLYGPETFCLVLAQLLGLELVSPADDLLLRVPPAELGRPVERATLPEVAGRDFPLFVKSLIPKQIRSRVYADLTELKAECLGLEPEVELLVSPPVEIRAEARAWLWRGKVLDCALYAGKGSAEAAAAQAEQMALELPEACVLDLALLAGGWRILEANACWGAGLNGCRAEAVLPCIRAATRG